LLERGHPHFCPLIAVPQEKLASAEFQEQTLQHGPVLRAVARPFVSNGTGSAPKLVRFEKPIQIFVGTSEGFSNQARFGIACIFEQNGDLFERSLPIFFTAHLRPLQQEIGAMSRKIGFQTELIQIAAPGPVPAMLSPSATYRELIGKCAGRAPSGVRIDFHPNAGRATYVR
jgi:hypothetical protein